MTFPVVAPLLLFGAASCFLAGTLSPPFAPFAFGWGAPCCFLSLSLVMVKGAGRLSLPSVLLICGSVLGLVGSACKSDHLAASAVCQTMSTLPPLVRPLLAFTGPALLTGQLGPDPVLLSWLAAAAVGIVPALPPDTRALVWQPPVISAILLLVCCYFMLRPRWLAVVEPLPGKKSS